MARSKSDATKPVDMLDELAEQFSARYHPHSGITMLLKKLFVLGKNYSCVIHEQSGLQYCLYGNERRCAKCNYNNSGARSFLCCNERANMIVCTIKLTLSYVSLEYKLGAVKKK